MFEWFGKRVTNNKKKIHTITTNVHLSANEKRKIAFDNQC